MLRRTCIAIASLFLVGCGCDHNSGQCKVDDDCQALQCDAGKIPQCQQAMCVCTPDVPKGAPPPRHNNAPGAQVKTTADAAKLHSARKENDSEALKKAFALLDPAQRTSARKLLEDRGITAPGGEPKPTKPTTDDGTPLP